MSGIDKKTLNNQAGFVRKLMGEDQTSPTDIFSLVRSDPNITLIMYPLGRHISGIYAPGNQQKKETQLSSAVIVINSDMSYGRQRFTLAHELYHRHFDKNINQTICSVNIGSGDENEKKADYFASYLLMPEQSLFEKLQETGDNQKITIEHIVKIEQLFGLSRQAVLYRLKDDGKISDTEYSLFSRDVISSAKSLGYSTDLYRKSDADKNTGTYGYYIRTAKHLLDAELISNAKYEEILLDAFRDDLVYGEDIEDGEIID